VDESRLPEGTEEEPEDDTLEKVNQRLEAAVPSECKLEDILMEW
jgi:hypothetical protein